MAAQTPDAVQEGTFDGRFDTTDFVDPNELIEAMLGVKAKLEPDFDLTQLDPDERLQIRLDPNNAPKEMVLRFAHQMTFSKFPPIVVTKDPRIVDGNTRYRGRIERGERFAAALVIPIEYDTADDETQTRLHYLGLALNNSNGKPLDKVERRSMARDAIRLGMSTRQVSSTVGFPDKVINALRREVLAEQRLKAVGLEELVNPDNPQIREASLRVLGTVTESLDDQLFSGLATLTADAGFNASEVRAMATSVKEVGTPDLALDRLNREREANAQRIADRKRSGDGHPPASRALMQRLGFIINSERPTEAMVEANREKMEEHLAAVELAITRLSEVAELQRLAIAQAE